VRAPTTPARDLWPPLTSYSSPTTATAKTYWPAHPTKDSQIFETTRSSSDFASFIGQRFSKDFGIDRK
jgi:hypothetical protein